MYETQLSDTEQCASHAAGRGAERLAVSVVILSFVIVFLLLTTLVDGVVDFARRRRSSGPRVRLL